jgi:Protein of unknown function (DUF664)
VSVNQSSLSTSDTVALTLSRAIQEGKRPEPAVRSLAMDSDVDEEAILAEPPVAGNELNTLLGELERVRGYIAWKCGGLDSAGLRATLGPSTMTLGGLLKHLSLCEDHMFSTKLYGQAPDPPWNTVDWDADPDWEWHSAAADSPERLISLWQYSVSRSRELVAKALADGGLDHAAASSDGRTPSLRRLLIDMIEEYARHVGHADLIRESVDGLVGEDPPGGRH